MSNDLAVAAVTATLREVLTPAVRDDVAGAEVNMLRPDAIDGLDDDGRGVNVFLYRVTPDEAYRNGDLPTRRRGGQMVERPTLALDLHYLLTFYGDDRLLEPQRLLGSALRVLHARPVLTRESIRDTIASVDYGYLADADLADQVELVKFTPIGIDIEALSNLWSMFFQVPYRLSAAYIAHLVLIETDDSPRRAAPVRSRNLYVRPFRHPSIESIANAEGEHLALNAESTVRVSGQRLRGEVTRLRIGTASFEPVLAHITDRQITVDLETTTPTVGSLRAGIQSAQVVHRLLMGTPPVEHEGVESNVVALTLHPFIQESTPGSYRIAIAPATVPDPSDPRTITIHVTPPVAPRQSAVLMLNEFNEPAHARGYSFRAEPRLVETDELRFVIRDVVADDYLVQVQVDGVASGLELDETTGSPTLGLYHAPRLAIA